MSLMALLIIILSFIKYNNCQVSGTFSLTRYVPRVILFSKQTESSVRMLLNVTGSKEHNVYLLTKSQRDAMVDLSGKSSIVDFTDYTKRYVNGIVSKYEDVMDVNAYYATLNVLYDTSFTVNYSALQVKTQTPINFGLFWSYYWWSLFLFMGLAIPVIMVFAFFIFNTKFRKKILKFNNLVTKFDGSNKSLIDDIKKIQSM